MARLPISPNERLLLQLLEFDRHRDDPEVPMGASQEGLAKGLGTQVHTVSRSLAGLQREGLVIDRLAHVKGAQRRRRAYFLTEKGRKSAQAIKDDVLGRSVVLVHGGKAQELRLGEALKRVGLMTRRIPGFLEFVDAARDSETVVVEDAFGRVAESRPPSELAAKAHGRPSVVGFFGRDQERERILQLIHSDEHSVMLIWGMPGIGKSMLASKIYEELLGKLPVFWYTFREWDTDSSFLAALADFLSSSCKDGSSVAGKRVASAEEAFSSLAADFSSSSMVLFLDDIQKPAHRIEPLLTAITEAAKTSGKTKLLLMSRSIPAFYPPVAPRQTSMELHGLDRDSAWKLAHDLGAKDTGRVVSESHGHPFLITLMARGEAIGSTGSVISFIEKEVYASLEKSEKAIIEMLSIYRHPVPLEALADADYSVVAALRKRALATEQEDGIWTHDLLREFFSARLDGNTRVSLHRQAAEYCSRRQGPEWKLEALHHSEASGDWDDARRVYVENAQELVRDFPEETLSILGRMEAPLGKEEDSAEYLFLRGQLREHLSDHESALEDYELSLELLGENAESRAVVLESIARLQSKVKRWAESIAAHTDALRIHESSGDLEGQAREWMSLGGVLRLKGDFRGARRAFTEAMALATREENRPAQAACLNNLALVDWDQGRLHDAEGRMKESIKLAHTVKDDAGEARGLENLASMLRSQHRLAEVPGLMLGSAEAYMRSGEVAESKRMHASCAETLGEQGKFSQAVDVCERALARPEFRRRRGLFQREHAFDLGDVALSSALVDLHRGSGDYRKAGKELERYSEMAESMEDTSLMGKARFLRAVLHEDAGELELAMKSLAEAQEFLRESGDSEGLIAVALRRGTIMEKTGDYAGAREQYSEALRHAEFVGNERAQEIARENIKSTESGLT